MCGNFARRIFLCGQIIKRSIEHVKIKLDERCGKNFPALQVSFLFSCFNAERKAKSLE